MLIALDRKAFEHALTQWAEALLSRPIAAAASLPEAYALDGKSARGSFDGLQKAVHLLSLLAHESGLTLAQAAVPNGGEDKTNEHKAALRLLEGLVLQGRLVTGDAIFCQRDFCRQVIDAEGDYLVFVKDNQPTLLNDIRMAFAPPVEGAFSPSAATNLGSRHGHGDDPRQGTRSNRASHVEGDDGVERLSGLAGCWPSRTGRERGGQGRQDLARDPLLHHQCFEAGGQQGQLLKWARGHWSVENRSHYVRDVTMGEDASRIRKRSGPEVMAAFRNATIGLLRTMGVTNIAEALRRNASQVGGLFARLGILKQ